MDHPPLDHAALLALGVRFPRVGCRLTVMGPPDPAIAAQIKAEVDRRMPLLQSLEDARKAVLGARKDLRPGECETCGSQVATIIERRDAEGVVRLSVRTDTGGGMCGPCLITRQKIVFERLGIK